VLGALRVFFHSRSDTALEILALASHSPGSNASDRGQPGTLATGGFGPPSAASGRARPRSC
jgi:hypothetical protein